MDSDLHALELPAFELDCRDWLVATPDDGTVPEEVGGAPVVAVLSTAVITMAGLSPASAVLSIGLLDEPVESVRLDADSPVAELIDSDVVTGSARYVVPPRKKSASSIRGWSRRARGSFAVRSHSCCRSVPPRVGTGGVKPLRPHMSAHASWLPWPDEHRRRAGCPFALAGSR